MKSHKRGLDFYFFGEDFPREAYRRVLIFQEDLMYRFPLAVGLSFLFLFSSLAFAQSSDEELFFPLSEAEMLDTSTLEEKILVNRVVDSVTHPGLRFRIMRVSYFSHMWKDGAWFGKVSIAVPLEIAPDRLGMMAICPIGSSNINPDFDLERNYFEYTALEYGIPVMGIPMVGEHYGHTEIHDLSDYLNMQFIETGDASWLGAYPSAAVRARGITLLSKLTGHDINSVVHLGSSISAGHGYVLARFDSRIKGLVATGSIGCFQDLYPSDGSFVSSRPSVDALAAMPEPMRDLFSYHRDPAVFGGELDCSVLLVTGIRDHAVPPLVVPKLTNALGGETFQVQVPDYGHGCGTHRHADAFRMWIDHVLLSEEKPEWTDVSAVRDGETFRCSAVLENEVELGEPRLWYLPVEDSLYFQSVNFSDTPDPNYTSAEWESIPMWKVGGEWVGEVPYVDPSMDHVAWFIDYRGGEARKRSYASTRVMLHSSATFTGPPEKRGSGNDCFATSIWAQRRLGTYLILFMMGMGLILVGLLSRPRRRGESI